MFAIVNCVDGFSQQPAVVNGASDFLVKVFGEANGKHARSGNQHTPIPHVTLAIGSNSLPLNVPVEIELIAEIKE